MERIRKSLMEQPGQLGLPMHLPQDNPTSPATVRSTAEIADHPSFVPIAQDLHQPADSPAPVSSADWTEDSLVRSNNNFNHVPRVSSSLPAEELLAKIKEHEASGVPLIVEGWHEHPGWNPDLFSVKSFVGDGEQIVEARNVRTAQDVKMPLRQLVEHYEAISKRTEPEEQTRFYGKDVQCPEKWEQWLKYGILPPHIHPFGPSDMFSHLPIEDRPETLMCYLGIGDTFTPAHKDLCGSFGQNIMCHTADGGSAFWFMSATGPLHKDEPAEYFHDALGAELDLESHMVTVAELGRAPFGVYVAEQRLGDLVLVPPRSCHQVVNRGGVTIKMSWSRMGLKSFELSLYDELPLYHRVCRQEIYRVKLNTFYAVKEYARRLAAMDSSVGPSSSDQPELGLSVSPSKDISDSTGFTPSPLSDLSETRSTLKSLLILLDDILVEEWNPDHMNLTHLAIPPPGAPNELHSCDFCGADIFQSFFACSKCADGDTSSEFICCPSCYVEGRSCTCDGGVMEPRQSRPFDDLINEFNKAVKELNVHLQESEQLRILSSRSMEISKHLFVFVAACKLLDSKSGRAEHSRGRPFRRCTTRSDPAHDASMDHVLSCGGCHAYMCFRHILALYDVHSAEALLVHAQDLEQAAWHTLHLSKTGKRKALTLSERRGRGRYVPPPLANRMAWVAMKFRKCRPVDAMRAKEGFYDDYSLAGPVEEHQDGEMQRTLGPGTIDNVQAVRACFDVPTSPLTALTDLDGECSMDLDDSSSSDGSTWSPPPRTPLSNRRRVIAKTSAKSVGPVPVTPRRMLMDYVAIPSIGKKRIIASDAAVSTTPPKKAKTSFSPRTPGPRPRLHSPVRRVVSESAAATNLGSTAKQVMPHSRQVFTVVPLATPSHSPSSSGLLRKQPAATPAGTMSAPKPGRLPPGARVGPPPTSAKRKRAMPRVSSSRESSPSRPPPLESSPARRTSKTTPSRSHMETLDSFRETVNVLTHTLEDERKDKQQLNFRLSQAESREVALKIEVRKLKEESSVRLASDLRAQNDRLNQVLMESQQRVRGGTQREEAKQRDLDSQEELWRRAWADRERDVDTLTGKLRDSEASVSNLERSIATMAGMLGRGIGPAMQNVPQQVQVHFPPVQYPAQVGPSAQTLAVVGLGAQGSHLPFTPSGPRVRPSLSPTQVHVMMSPPQQRGRGMPIFSSRGRGMGRNTNMAGRFHQRPQEQSRHIVGYSRVHGSARGRSAPVQYSSARNNRARATSQERRVVYERSSEPDMYDDDGSTSAQDHTEYQGHNGDGREASPYSQSSTRPIAGTGDGGWVNVRLGRRTSSSLSPAYNRDISPFRHDMDDDREPLSRPSTPDNRNYLDARATSEPPSYEQRVEELDEQYSKSNRAETPPRTDQPEIETRRTLPPSSWSSERTENPWSRSPNDE